ncbi:MAG: hypothetical protein WC998_04065, partial [Candidatus Paceibacterota bacterium]
ANISSLTGDLQNKAILRIGGEGLTTNRIVGKIDEIALYSAVVPTSQIKEQYYLGLNKLLSSGGISLSEYRENILNLSKYSASE